jgi:hypothetical protein
VVRWTSSDTNGEVSTPSPSAGARLSASGPWVAEEFAAARPVMTVVQFRSWLLERLFGPGPRI